MLLYIGILKSKPSLKMLSQFYHFIRLTYLLLHPLLDRLNRLNLLTYNASSKYMGALITTKRYTVFTCARLIKITTRS